MYETNHILNFTGETPYECKFCDRKFADRGNHRVHMKNHEREMGIKLTFTPEERRLMKLNVLAAGQLLNPSQIGIPKESLETQ